MPSRYDGKVEIESNYDIHSPDRVFFSKDDPKTGSMKVYMIRDLKRAIANGLLSPKEDIRLLTFFTGSSDLYLLDKTRKAGEMADIADAMLRVSKDLRYSMQNSEDYAEAFEAALPKLIPKSQKSQKSPLLV